MQACQGLDLGLGLLDGGIFITRSYNNVVKSADTPTKVAGRVAFSRCEAQNVPRSAFRGHDAQRPIYASTMRGALTVSHDSLGARYDNDQVSIVGGDAGH